MNLSSTCWKEVSGPAALSRHGHPPRAAGWHGGHSIASTRPSGPGSCTEMQLIVSQRKNSTHDNQLGDLIRQALTIMFLLVEVSRRF